MVKKQVNLLYKYDNNFDLLDNKLVYRFDDENYSECFIEDITNKRGIIHCCGSQSNFLLIRYITYIEWIFY